MGRIFITSDWHFGHDKEFLYKPRGFESIQEHDEKVIMRHNLTVTDDDDVYVLGDLMLGDQEYGLNCISKLNGKIHIIVGNHDTIRKLAQYQTLPNVVEVIGWALMYKYGKYHFYLSHYPTITGNYDDKLPRQCVINLHGHTHQNYSMDINQWNMYHVGLDSHQCYPVLIDDIIEDINNNYLTYKK
jgi:calcineurin-like phosphoesterase family protein